MDAAMITLIATIITSIGGVVGMLITASSASKERDYKQDQQNAVFSEKLSVLERQGKEMQDAIKSIHTIETKIAVQGEKIDKIERQLNKQKEI